METKTWTVSWGEVSPNGEKIEVNFACEGEIDWAAMTPDQRFATAAWLKFYGCDSEFQKKLAASRAEGEQLQKTWEERQVDDV